MTDVSPHKHIVFSQNVDHTQLEKILIDQHKIDPKSLLRIILCGNSGCGKSLIANKIGESPQLFESKRAAEGVTNCCERALLRFSTESKFIPPGSGINNILLYNIPGLLEASSQATGRNKKFIAQAFQEMDAAKTIVLFVFDVITGQRLRDADFNAFFAIRDFINPPPNVSRQPVSNSNFVPSSCFTIVINNVTVPPDAEGLDALKQKARAWFVPEVHECLGTNQVPVLPLPNIRGSSTQQLFDTSLAEVLRDATLRAVKIPRIEIQREITVASIASIIELRNKFQQESAKLHQEMKQQEQEQKATWAEAKKNLERANEYLEREREAQKFSLGAVAFAQGVASAKKQ